MMEDINPSLFQILKEQRRQEDLCNKDRGKYVHLHSPPTLCLDASLQGGISTGRPPDWRGTKVFSQIYAAETYFFKEGTFEGVTTMLKIIDGRLGKFMKFTLLSSTHLFVLEGMDSKICVDMSIVLKGYPISLEQQRILQYMMNISFSKGRY